MMESASVSVDATTNKENGAASLSAVRDTRPPAAAVGGDGPAPDAAAQVPREKARYKSWRKKYRKMKHRFDDRMEEANELFLASWRAEQVARRIKEQNDQLLEILADINDSHDLPAHKRYDVRPPQQLQTLTPQTPDSTIKPDDNGILASLEAAALHTVHADVSPSILPLDLQVTEHAPPGYITPTHEDEYLGIMDEALEALPLPNLDMPSKPIGNAVLDPNVDIRPRRDDMPTERDFAEQSSVSVYNWIRMHQPQVHAEKERKDDRPGDSDRGGRSPPPPASGTSNSKRKAKDKLKKEDAPFEHLDDEIGFDALDEPTFGTSRNKRKKDDEAYRPKGGKSRQPQKRKRERDDAGTIEGEVISKKARKVSAEDDYD